MFKRGDVVVHPRRPEWGDGVVDQATNLPDEGPNAQRLIIVFANQGRVTLNTSAIQLQPKGTASDMTTARTNDPLTGRSANGSSGPTVTAGKGWLDQMASVAKDSLGGKKEHELWRLPEPMTDPFLSVEKRLDATLDSYRFGNDPRNPRLLLEWAIGQTGLNDPLSKYTRHELEQAFPRFIRDRDNHLFSLVRPLKKAGKYDTVNDAWAKCENNPGARNALMKAMRD